MRFLFIFCCLILLLPLRVFSQEQLKWEYDQNNEPVLVLSIPEIEQPLTAITLNQPTGLSKVYLVNEDNQSISSSYIPGTTYLYRHPENKELNCYFTSGNPDYKNRDSFNPFGARSIEEAVVLGVVNTFFSKIMKNIHRR